MLSKIVSSFDNSSVSRRRFNRWLTALALSPLISSTALAASVNTTGLAVTDDTVKVTFLCA